MTGIIILSARSDGGGYRPDEIKLLNDCVRSYAADLESLRVAELEYKNVSLELRSAELERIVEILQQRRDIALDAPAALP